jgi:protein-disulfide isomerase
VPLRAPAGFRGLVGPGAPPGGGADWLTAGLEAPATDPAPPLRGADLCAALFDGAAVGPRVAVLTDAYCPFCRRMEAALARLGADHPGLTVTFHDWPRLSPQSAPVARAILAAALQGGEAAFRARVADLAARPVAASVARVARDAGLDPDRLQADMTASAVTARLTRAAGIAAAFGAVGTPMIVVEDTVIHGAVPDGVLARVLRDARPPTCT